MTRQFMLDLSSYQSGITVDQIKQAGAKAVVIKLTESTNYVNPYIAQQINTCKQAGIKYIHFYHFQRATSVDGLTAEANYCVNVAQKYGYKGSFIFLDAELKDAVPSTAAVQSFYKVIRDAGYRAGFYTYKFMYPYFNSSVFTSCDGVWAAAYPLGNEATDESPDMGYFPSIDNCVAWQFTDNWCGLNLDCSYTLTDALLNKAGCAVTEGQDTYLHSKRAKRIITKHETGLYDGYALSKAKVIATIPKDKTLWVVDSWFEGDKETDLSRFKVEYDGKTGWVSGNDDIVESAYWLMDSYGDKHQIRFKEDDWIYDSVNLDGKKYPVSKGDVFTVKVNTTDKWGAPKLETTFGMYTGALKWLVEWI